MQHASKEGQTLILTLALLEAILNVEVKSGRMPQEQRDAILITLREQATEMIDMWTRP